MKKKAETLKENHILQIRSSGNPEKVIATGKYVRDLQRMSYKEIVDVFEKRTEEWYLGFAGYCDKSGQPGANFTVTILCCILLDLLSQYASGSPASSRESYKKFFRENLQDINHPIEPPIESCYYDNGKWIKEEIKDVADAFYHCFRCSILHCGRILEYGRINPLYPEEIIKIVNWGGGREVNLNPSEFLNKLKKIFKDYISKLKAEDPDCKSKFIDKIKWEYGIAIKA